MAPWARLRSAAHAPGSRALWSVGWQSYDPDDGVLIERHRAGAWTHMFPPTRGLYGVTAVAWNDIWAVGPNHHPEQPERSATAVHWNGNGWSVVPTPSQADRVRDLHAVSAVSASNVWAVGAERSLGGIGEALIEHWDGSDWSVAPAPAGIDQGLSDVSMGRYGYGWAVGYGNGAGVILRHCPA